MTPLERAAVALKHYDDVHDDEPVIPPCESIEDLRKFAVDHEQYLARARAALEAVRNASSPMIQAAYVLDQGNAQNDAETEPETMWRTMIDAALKEG